MEAHKKNQKNHFHSVKLLVSGGTRLIGKIGLLTLPLCFMLLVSLVIRSCVAPGGADGIMTLLSPDWSQLSSFSGWMMAAQQVVYSLQLGLGVITSYSSYNNYHHNIIR